MNQQINYKENTHKRNENYLEIDEIEERNIDVQKDIEIPLNINDMTLEREENLKQDYPFCYEVILIFYFLVFVFDFFSHYVYRFVSNVFVISFSLKVFVQLGIW